ADADSDLGGIKRSRFASSRVLLRNNCDATCDGIVRPQHLNPSLSPGGGLRFLEHTGTNRGYFGCRTGQDRRNNVTTKGRFALQQLAFVIDVEVNTVAGQSEIEPCGDTRSNVTPSCSRA